MSTGNTEALRELVTAIVEHDKAVSAYYEAERAKGSWGVAVISHAHPAVIARRAARSRLDDALVLAMESLGATPVFPGLKPKEADPLPGIGLLAMMSELGCTEESRLHVGTLLGMLLYPGKTHRRDNDAAIAYFSDPPQAAGVPDGWIQGFRPSDVGLRRAQVVRNAVTTVMTVMNRGDNPCT